MLEKLLVSYKIILSLFTLKALSYKNNVYNYRLKSGKMVVKFFNVISLYYKEKTAYLRCVLDSLVSQTLPASEIVVVFDEYNSWRFRAQVCNILLKNYNLLFVSLPQNVGLGPALNEGLKHCSNEWVFRMDTDDVAYHLDLKSKLILLVKILMWFYWGDKLKNLTKQCLILWV